MKNWNGYLIDLDGTIYNKNGTKKSLKTNVKGYLFSNFYVDGKLICKLAHTIVAEAYLGKKPLGFETDHINNIRNDNRVCNLQYLSKSDNNKKSYDSGNRNISGDNNPNSLFRKSKERSETIPEGSRAGS